MNRCRNARVSTRLNAVGFCLVLASLVTGCSFQSAPEPSESPATGSAAPTKSGIPGPTVSGNSTESKAPVAIFSGVGRDVAFSFEYPVTWTVKSPDPSDQSQEAHFVVTDETGSEVASLQVRPVFSLAGCSGACDDMPVSYLGEVPGQGNLAGKSYSVQTKAMDLTSRKDLQEASHWEGNIRLIVGVVGAPATTPAQDPSHFATGAGIQTNSSSESFRPIIFSASRHFETMTEAKAYTSSVEHSEIRAMMGSLQAFPAAGTARGTPTPTAVQTERG